MIKALALVAVVGLFWALPSGWDMLAAVLVVLGTLAFLTYAVWHPRSQFFVPVLDRIRKAFAGDHVELLVGNLTGAQQDALRQAFEADDDGTEVDSAIRG